MGYVLQIDKDHFEFEYDPLIQNKVNIEIHDMNVGFGEDDRIL
jgi:hypothetical protein